jgi:hypothetical protein
MDNDYREVRIIHPETGGIATVPDTSLGQHYLAGWVPLAAEDAPEYKPGPGEPVPLTEAQVADGLRKRADELAPPGKPAPPTDSPPGKQAAAKTSGHAAGGGKNTEE